MSFLISLKTIDILKHVYMMQMRANPHGVPTRGPHTSLFIFFAAYHYVEPLVNLGSCTDAHIFVKCQQSWVRNSTKHSFVSSLLLRNHVQRTKLHQCLQLSFKIENFVSFPSILIIYYEYFMFHNLLSTCCDTDVSISLRQIYACINCMKRIE